MGVITLHDDLSAIRDKYGFDMEEPESGAFERIPYETRPLPEPEMY